MEENKMKSQYISGRVAERRIVKRICIIPFKIMYILQEKKYYTYMDHDGEWYTTKWIDITITDKDSYKTYKTVKRMGLKDVGRI